MSPTVAVIGVGPLGLMALKNLKEDGFEVRGFERRTWVGGVWKQSHDSHLSTTPHTVFNSSRFRSAISDYPFPDDVDDYPTAKQIWTYLENYCDHFKLRPLIHFGTEVTTFSRVGGKWAVDYVQDGLRHTANFDKLLVSHGTHTIPRTPKLKDIEHFEGKVLHSLNFPDPSAFQDQNVLLVGLHATAQDLVVELAPHAKKVYVAHKSGIVLISRFTADGKAFDEVQSLSLVLIQMFLTTWFPRFWDWILDRALRDMTKKAYPNVREEWNLLPAPSASTTAPLVADAMYPFLGNGFAEPIPPVQQILGPKSLRLTDGRVLEDVDAIIYTTGYESAIPFAPKEYNPYPLADQEPVLYRNIFPLHPDPAVRKSLAFLGQGAIPFPGFVQFEPIIWAISQIWQEKAELPPLAEMENWHKSHMAWRNDIVRRSKFDSKFHPVFLQVADHLEWLDKTSGAGLLTHFSWFSLRSWLLWWSDWEFYALCKNGLFTPALWRLIETDGRKAWPGARQQIIKDNEFAKMRRKERLKAKGRADDSRKGK